MIQGEQVQDSELSTQAVIYLGPSSMSLMVAEAVRDRIRLLDFLQQPVPMARDIFRFHRISRHTMDRCVQIIGDYLEISQGIRSRQQAFRPVHDFQHHFRGG